MRYEDASQTGSVGNDVNARDDADHLAANDFGPATGNLITGTGTITGATGTDSGGQIVAIVGAGGSDDSFADGQLEVAGQYGTLTIDTEGNYSYVRNPGTPDGVSDTFTYTLAGEAGATDTANLVINIGDIPMLQAEGTQTIQTNNGVIVLPAGVELSDVRVVGRDLVITLPDGSTMVIPDGAIFVPQLVIDGVEVPASNLAALLIDAEPRPAAGGLTPAQQSGGGNFEVPVQPLDPGVPLGDLLPPTELTYTPPEFDDPGIEPDDNDPPLITPSAINVSEEGVATVAAPIPDNAGSPDTTNLRIVNGHITVVDPDGDSVVITLGAPSDSLTSQGVPITWSVSPDGHTVTGSAGVNTVITIVIEDDGDYTVTLSRPVDHPNGGGEQGTSFVVPVFATDGEDPALPSSITVTIEDDSPVVDNVTVRGGVTLDETDAGTPAGFPISDTTDGAIIVNSSGGFGADGPAAANSIVYGLGLTGGVSSLASGLATAIGDHPITLVQIDADTIQGQYADGGTQVAFIIQMNGDGSVTLTQNVPLEHLTDGPPGPAHDDSLDLSGLVNATVTYTDFDGDTANGSAPIGGSLIFKDDGPNASVNEQAALDTVVLDETRPEGTDTADGDLPSGDASATINFADNFLAADFGADGAGTVTYQLILSANGIGSGLYALQAGDTTDGDGDGYGQGAEITLSQTGDTITGSVGDVDYFTISIDPTTGVVTFTQLNPIWHSVPGDFDESATLNTEAAGDIIVQQTVTDSDGDTDTASVDIGQGVFSIEDDGPDPYDPCPDDVISVNDPNADPFTGSLNLPDVGEDEPGVVTFGVNDGDPVLDTEGNPVTSGEDPLFYFINGDGVLEARVGDESGELIFTITLNGDGTFTYDQIGTIGIGGSVTFDNFDEADAGNTNYVGLGNDDPSTPVDLLMSAGENTDADPAIEDTTVNTDSDSIGAQNQSMDANDSEVLRLDFVSDLQTGGAGPTGFSFSGHVATNSYLQLVPQVQGSQEAVAAFKVWALDSTLTDAAAPDRDPSDGFSDATPVTITEVTIVDYQTGVTHTEDISGLANGATEVLAFGVSVTRNADGSVTFSGIQEGDQYGVATGANDFNAIAIQATSHSFDLGVFSIGVANEFEPVDLEVPVILTDADGDPVTCEIDIHIGAPIDAPDITVTVNEAGLPVIGSDAASDSEIQSGDLQGLVTGGTGPYTFTLVGDGNGTYGTLVLNEDGTFTFTLDTPFDSQPDADDGTNPELGAESFTFEATDSLGATQTGTITINIIDDVPSVSVSGVEPALTVDDTTLGTNASASFAGIFVPVFGADGEGSPAIAYALGVSAPGADSGLVDVATGNSVFLFLEAGVVVGREGTSALDAATGDVVFTVSVNGSGLVTLDQQRAVEHNDPNDPVESGASAAGLTADNLVTLTATVEDGDGDLASATTNIGSNLNFEDDGPSVTVSGTEPQLTVDDTTLGTNASASFAGIFIPNFGADGQGSPPIAYALGVSAPGADSGLVDVATGNSVFLFLEAGVVVGREGTSALDAATGDVVFTVSVNGAGLVTLDQQRAVEHNDPNDPVESGASAAGLTADNLVTLTATVEDGDGDTATATANIGANLHFEDDGPSVIASGAEPTLTVDDTTLGTNASSSFAGLFIPNYGADGQGSPPVAYALGVSAPGANSGLVDVATGNSVFLFLEAGVVVGREGTSALDAATGDVVFTVSVNGSGLVTLDQQRAVQHNDPNDPVESGLSAAGLTADNLVTLTATVEDGDGDTATATVNIGSNLKFEDDGPAAADDTDTVGAPLSSATGNVITDASAGDAGDTDSGADDVGADEPGSVVGVAVGDTNTVLNSPGTVGVQIQGAYGKLTLNSDGSYTYTRDADTPGGVDDVFTYTLSDADGDKVTATLTITIADEAPVAGTETATVDDDGLANANPGGTNDIDANVGETPSTNSSEAIYNGTLNATGGDGDLDFVLVLPAGNATVGQETVSFTLNPAGTLLTATIATSPDATRVGDPLFTVSLDAETGNYVVTLVDNVLHGDDANNDEDGIEVQVTVPYQVEDSDGSPSAANGQLTISFNDDVPSASASTTQPDLTTDDSTLGTNASSSFAGVFTTAFGADGPALANSTVYALGVSAPGADSGVIDVATGNAVFLFLEAGVVVGREGTDAVDAATGAVVFTVSVNGAGLVTLDQQRAVEHNNPADPVESGASAAGLSADTLVTLTATVTDADGDVASATANIGSNLHFEDDGPSVIASGAEPTLTVDDTTLGTNASASFAGLFIPSYGADGQGSPPIAYALGVSAPGVDSGVVDVATGNSVFLFLEAGVVVGREGTSALDAATGDVVFTVSVNGSGLVTLDQQRAVEHNDPNDPVESGLSAVTLTADNLITLTATVEDGDGDTATATVNIGSNLAFEDDGPQAIQPDAATLSNEIGASATEDLDDDGEVITDFGADGPGLVQFANITNGDDSGFDSDGDDITYWLSNNGQTLEGRTNSTDGEDGELVFTVQINQASGDYTVTMAGTVDNGAGVTFNNLTSTKAGNVDVRGVGADDPATTVDLLLTASSNGANATINTSSSTVGSANQSMDQGETIRIDFVTNLEDDPADNTVTFPSGFSYDGHVGTSSFLQLIPQVQGSQSATVAFRVYALDTTVTDSASPDDTPVAGPTPFSDSTTIPITHVTVDGFDVGETPVTVALGAVGTWTTVAYGVFARLETDGSVTFTGIQEGDRYGIETGTDFNAVAVTSLPSGVGPVGNVSSINSFDLGVFAIGSVDTGEPVELSFDLKITDGDGDSIVMPGAIDITLEPVVAVASLALAETSGPESLSTTSSLLVSETQEVERVAANSNSVTLAAAVAAAGMAASSAAAAAPAIGGGSDQLISNAVVSKIAYVDLDGGGSFGGGLSGLTAMRDGGFDFGMEAMASTSYQALATGNIGELTANLSIGSGPNALLEATDFGAMMHMPAPSTGMNVAMPSTEALMAMSGGLDAQQTTGSVEQILADALQGGGSAANIDALLNSLPSAGLGAEGGLNGLATPVGNGVPTWDMGHGGVFTFDAAMIITNEAMVLHHDAVQPVANG